jgi:ubiquinone/menaquinone biosynthesis C-methylase UbiE
MQKRFACTTGQYNTLYCRYLQQPEKLLEMVDYHTHHDLLDLCGGTGAISKAALNIGANPQKITLLDLNPRLQHENITQICADALQGLEQLANLDKQFDVVACRQAFAYLEIDGEPGNTLAQLLATIIRPQGRFIFNSFIRPRWMLKTYNLNSDILN